MNTSTPQSLPPLPEIYPTFDHPDHHMKWTKSEVTWIKDYATNYATEAMPALAATLEAIHKIIQCAGPDAATEIADLLGYPSVEWPSDQAASVEPVAYMTADGRISMRSTVETAMPRAARESFIIPLYTSAPPSPAHIPADDIDEAALARMKANGAKAWAGHIPSDVEAMNARQVQTIKHLRRALASIHARLQTNAPLIDSHAISLIVVECEAADPELIGSRPPQAPQAVGDDAVCILGNDLARKHSVYLTKDSVRALLESAIATKEAKL